MAKRLRVYSGKVMRGAGQHHAIIAAHNAQEVAAALGNASAYYARGYWSLTGNENDIKEAMAQPGVLLVETGGEWSGKYERDRP